MRKGKGSTAESIDRAGHLSPAAELRLRAEEQLQAKTVAALAPPDKGEKQRLLHELEVHQIELEMQNTELRQARDEMETALDRFTDLYDFAPVGYLTLDITGVIGNANFTAASQLGTGRAQLTGRHFGSIVAPGCRPAFSAFLGTVFSGQCRQTCEIALLNYARQSLFVQMEALPAASGLECRVALIDISLRRQLEECIEMQHTELAARSVELAAANLELEAFNYTISHDLRGTLTIIQGYSEFLQNLPGDQFQAQAGEYIREIHDGALHMNRLLNSLLKFSLTAHAEIQGKQVDLSTMAEKVTRGLETMNREPRVTFQIAKGIMVEGDPDLLQVVLDNLIGNAWKYCSQRGQPVIEFGLTEIDGAPTCYVRDNGPGFDMADADKLFTPFKRLPGSDVDGHGIGLASVDRIIKRHGGRVWAESIPGKGATFFFTLQ